MLIKKIFIYSTIFILLFNLGVLFFPNISLADEQISGEISDLKSAAESLNPGNFHDPSILAGRFIIFWIAGMGAISLVLVVVAGIIYMTASGNAEKTKQSAQIIIWVVLGLTATLASYMILKQVFNFIG